jgi:kynureninase
MPIRTDAAYAAELDATDPLAQFRTRFVHSDAEMIYLDGNSLGRLPHATASLANEVIQQQWGDRLIRGWNDGWFTLPERVGGKVAQLIGAQQDEVVIADSTSVNLFKLVVAALRDRPGRTRIITDNLNFPSDLYILQGAIDLLGNQHQIEVIASPDGIHGPVEAISAALDSDVALVTLSHTVFKSGYTYDMAAITQAAHAAGALVVWDLSHSGGSYPVQLNVANADRMRL